LKAKLGIAGAVVEEQKQGEESEVRISEQKRSPQKSPFSLYLTTRYAGFVDISVYAGIQVLVSIQRRHRLRGARYFAPPAKLARGCSLEEALLDQRKEAPSCETDRRYV
jgi:hypothetical protein